MLTTLLFSQMVKKNVGKNAVSPRCLYGMMGFTFCLPSIGLFHAGRSIKHYYQTLLSLTDHIEI